MSKILMILDRVDDRNSFIAEIRLITKMPILKLKKALEEGTPFFEETLFLSNHEEIALNIIEILKIIDKFQAEVKIFEVDDFDSFNILNLKRNYKINEEILKNILKTWVRIKN